MIWNIEKTKEFIKNCSQIMDENKTHLIELDSIVGDGDLGLTMSDGFRASYEAVSVSTLTDCGKLFFEAGKKMSSAVPSTMGTLMSKGLMNIGKAFKGKEEIEGNIYLLILSNWFDGVAALGGAKVGDKTFLDGLAPVIEFLKENPEAAKEEIIACAAKAVDATVGMLAVHGRAAIRGESSRSLVDPGAVVASLIIKALVEIN